MSRLVRLVVGISLCVGLAEYSIAECRDRMADANDVPRATLIVTRLDVTDSTFDVCYRFRNGTEDDIWLCDNVNVTGGSSFETYLSEDGSTLFLRKRHDVPTAIVWYAPPTARYTRVRPGQDRTGIMSFTLPVTPRTTFADLRYTEGVVDARRVVLQVGFYRGDLPAMIRGILTQVERLGCSNLECDDDDLPIWERYFPGLLIRQYLGGLSGFDESNRDVGDEVLVPYTYRALSGERFLQVVVDGVAIPYSYERKVESSSGDQRKGKSGAKGE